MDRIEDHASFRVLFFQLRGIAKDVFQALGGGEEFIRAERHQLDTPPSDEPSRVQQSR
jgi:hypothetical protein